VLTRESARDVAIALRDMPAGATVVGWFHSHPGLGVFLSGTDLRTQRDCFGAEWQIAVVLDPQRREFGVFAGPDGAPARRQTLA
jgi:proteasome lid subunit RPN8/RPN11